MLKEVCNRTRTIAAKEINTVIHNGNIATKWSFQSNNPHQTQWYCLHYNEIFLQVIGDA